MPIQWADTEVIPIKGVRFQWITIKGVRSNNPPLFFQNFQTEKFEKFLTRSVGKPRHTML